MLAPHRPFALVPSVFSHVNYYLERRSEGTLLEAEACFAFVLLESYRKILDISHIECNEYY